MLRHLESGQEDRETDFRTEQPPHYDLLNIPIDPVTKNEKDKLNIFKRKKKEKQKKVIKKWLSAR